MRTIFNIFRNRCLLILALVFTWDISFGNTDTTAFSSTNAAIALLEKEKGLQQSKYWPNVEPQKYIENLRANLIDPFSLYEGRNTNFCSYAAMSYLPLQFDPKGFVQFMIDIYKNGKAKMGKVHFFPSFEVRKAAGTLRYKGELDIRPADQLWFLTLADQFKGYLNVFDHHFDMGDEDKLWAAVNFSKFNRMIRRLFNYHTESVGSDLVRPGFRNIYKYLHERISTGTTFLFVNNLFLYKKRHTGIIPGLPTHFIVLLDISETDGMINITYWDYGKRTFRQITPDFLRKIVFGITHCTKKISQRG